MNSRTTWIASATVAIGLLFSTSTYAALESRLGGQLVYDTDLNITWLADANLAASNSFGVTGIGSSGTNPTWNDVFDPGASYHLNGTMTWSTALEWVGAMNSANYLGFNDWRLPIMTGDCGTGFQSNPSCEMSHLFYNELGGVSGAPISSVHNANYNLFTSIQSENFLLLENYWSGNEVQQFTEFAWDFSFYNGNLFGNLKTVYLFAWPVRDGDVAAIPEPEVWGLMLTGLSLIGWARSKRRVGKA